MPITRLLAQLAVSSSTAAEPWYTNFFDRPPDARPMAGLLEWHLADSFGVQVWAEAARAGRCCVILEDTRLDDTAARLDRIGLASDGIQDATTQRILALRDPDGNRIVFTGPLPDRPVAR